MKVCKKCNESKDLMEFYNNSKAPDGKMSVCKACDKARLKARAKKKEDELNAIFLAASLEPEPGKSN